MPTTRTEAGQLTRRCDRTYALSFGATPGERAEELAALRSDAAVLQKRVDQDTTRLEAIDSEVRDECRRLKYRCIRHALAWGTAFFVLTLLGIVTGASA